MLVMVMVKSRLQKILIAHVRGFRDKISSFSGLHCLAIPRRDLSTKNQTKYGKMSRKPQSHVIILTYRMWPIKMNVPLHCTYLSRDLQSIMHAH